MDPNEKVAIVSNDLIVPYFIQLGGDHARSSICCGHPMHHLKNIILDNFTFKPRGEVEEDLTYRQIIPYQVIVQNQRNTLVDSDSIAFVFQRTKKQGETRLHGKWSIGIGGHVNINDFIFISRDFILNASMNRELNEETPAIVNRRELVAIIKSDANPVDSVHLCLLYRTVIEWRSLQVKERDAICNERWVNSVSSLKEGGIYDQLETWSQISCHLVLIP